MSALPKGLRLHLDLGAAQHTRMESAMRPGKLDRNEIMLVARRFLFFDWVRLGSHVAAGLTGKLGRNAVGLHAGDLLDHPRRKSVAGAVQSHPDLATFVDQLAVPWFNQK